MNKEELDMIIKAMEKGFKADSTATMGATYRDAKRYLEEANAVR